MKNTIRAKKTTFRASAIDYFRRNDTMNSGRQGSCIN